MLGADLRTPRNFGRKSSILIATDAEQLKAEKTNSKNG
jgi:hypothetical protein